MWFSWMPQIRLQQPFSHKNILRMEKPKKCQLPTFPCSSLIPSSNGVLWSRKGMWSTTLSRSRDTTLSRTENVKLDRWSLRLQGRNIQVEHITGNKNKAADCLSCYPLQPGRGITTPEGWGCLHKWDHSWGRWGLLSIVWGWIDQHEAWQQFDKNCIRIARLIEDPRRMFHKRDSYGYDHMCLLYHINQENGKE